MEKLNSFTWCDQCGGFDLSSVTNLETTDISEECKVLLKLKPRCRCDVPVCNSLETKGNVYNELISNLKSDGFDFYASVMD
ncbi:hypothetical protein DPMN_149092 [Dreissena polymorpha]|uniref:Uncharacterized protein n=1 Tax=Dreissena polymorpha TaxID=45954 RepID=A0A9D4FDR2_DREPO|nr:hypothetical protein DPMN_149092 [Dreissena polymorpha]